MAMFTDERSLAERARAGDADAFAELVSRHQAAIFNVAYRLLGVRQDAEDATQEALWRAYRAWATFDSARPLAPWLKQIAVNVCLSRLETVRPEADLPDDDEHLPGPPGEGDPERAAQASELSACVRAELLNLPPRFRAVIELRHFQELSYDEIAAALRRPLSDVKSDLFRARKWLAGRLKDYGPAE
jgi:RNA polymerase sigma-70 factor, ECF subfamily